MRYSDLWNYRDALHVSRDVNGYNVEATDCGIGKIDKAARAEAVIRTGPSRTVGVLRRRSSR